VTNDTTIIRVFVLDYLCHGPAHLDTLYRDAWAQSPARWWWRHFTN